MNDQCELMRAWSVGVLALYENSEAPAEIAQLSSRVLFSPQKETTPPFLRLPVPGLIYTTQIPPKDTFWCQGHPSN